MMMRPWVLLTLWQATTIAFEMMATHRRPPTLRLHSSIAWSDDDDDDKVEWKETIVEDTQQKEKILLKRLQTWVPKYTVQDDDKKIVLWHALARDQFPDSAHDAFMMMKTCTQLYLSTTTILPLLEEYRFGPDDCLTGTLLIMDSTVTTTAAAAQSTAAFTTPPLVPGTLGKTLPAGYVKCLNRGGGVSYYELGSVATNVPMDVVVESPSTETTTTREQQLVVVNPLMNINDIGSVAGSLALAATAYSLWSHHLTIQMFWV